MSAEQYEQMRTRHARAAAWVEQNPASAQAKSASRARGRPDPVSEVRPLEKDVLKAVLAALRAHPAVAFVWRANAGSFEVDGRRIRAGFRGQSDILGMLRDGRFLAVEVKRPGGRLTSEQAAFLAGVSQQGGVAIVATDVHDVLTVLQTASCSGCISSRYQEAP